MTYNSKNNAYKFFEYNAMFNYYIYFLIIIQETRGTLGLGSISSLDKTALFAPVGSYKVSVRSFTALVEHLLNSTITSRCSCSSSCTWY